MLRAALYMRVSTACQDVDSQRQELLKFIEARDDLEFVEEYSDTISGVREQRVELDRLMTDARQKKIDCVVFFDLSRLTRKGVSHAVKLLDEWKTAGVKPICFSFPMLDFTDESGTGELIACLLAWQAKQERLMIQRRIKAGLAARKAKGKRLGRRPLPMTTVSRVLRLRETGLSYSEISKALKISKGSISNIVKKAKEKAAESA